MRFSTLDLTLEAQAAVAPLIKRVQRHDRKLAQQLRDATNSFLLNLGEGAHSDPGNRRSRYQTAAGSTSEVLVGLRAGVGWGYFGQGELAPLTPTLLPRAPTEHGLGAFDQGCRPAEGACRPPGPWGRPPSPREGGGTGRRTSLRFERTGAETAENKPDSRIAIDEEGPSETSKWQPEWHSWSNPDARQLWDVSLHHALAARATELAATLPTDAVEKALCEALAVATGEARWGDVAQLARELEARRKARAATVDLGAERARRGNGR